MLFDEIHLTPTWMLRTKGLGVSIGLSSGPHSKFSWAVIAPSPAPLDRAQGVVDCQSRIVLRRPAFCSGYAQLSLKQPPKELRDCGFGTSYQHELRGRREALLGCVGPHSSRTL